MSIEEQHMKFAKAKEEFTKKLLDIMLYDQPTKTRYINLTNTDDSSGWVSVYLQCKTRNIFKIFVKYSHFGKDPISITSDDPLLEEKVTSLPSFIEMKDALVEIEEFASQTRLFEKLKHNI